MPDIDGDPDCEHDWFPLMFGEHECLTCGRVES